MNGENSLRLAIDIGGTFTDLVLETPRKEYVSHKLLTNHDNPELSILAGIDIVLKKANRSPSELSLIVHGTTLATNALIQRRGAKVAFLTTQGHIDTLAIAREERFEQYDINIDKARPLVPRYLRLPITERLTRDGEIFIGLKTSSILKALKTIKKEGAESIAVGYLHSYINPKHELETREILKHHRPDLDVSISSEVAPEIREYERFSTTVCNAYVQPLMAKYLGRIKAGLEKKDIFSPFLLITSGGGLTTLETARKFPIRLVESGPAGGAILASKLSSQLGSDASLSFDMGGTTAKLCLINAGEPRLSRQFEVDRSYRFKKGSGLPLKIPVIEMLEIGAGGGSIAYVDKISRIKVGPESAGSNPGPASYNLGGSDPTVTDADLFQGKMVAENFPFALNIESAKKAINKHISEKLGIPDIESALGVAEVVDENMASAARAHAAEFGLDLGARDLIAFGGAAPIHAARLGEKLRARRILIPKNAAVGSALGFLLAAASYEVVRSRHMNLHELNFDLINKIYEDMSEEALAIVTKAAPKAMLREVRQISMRYAGQGHELNIKIPNEIFSDNHTQILRDLFEIEYSRVYGHKLQKTKIEILSWMLTLFEDKNNLFPASKSNKTESHAEPISRQKFYNSQTKEFIEAPVYERTMIENVCSVKGPALIAEEQTTTVVPMGFTCYLDSLGNIVLEKSDA